MVRLGRRNAVVFYSAGGVVSVAAFGAVKTNNSNNTKGWVGKTA